MRRIDLSEEASPGLSWRAKLRHERERTGISPAALLSARADKPEDLKSRAVGDWLCGAAKFAREDHLAFVVATWAALPSVARVALEPMRRAELRALRENSGISVYALLAGRRDRPAGLTHGVITHWLDGSGASAREDHYAYVVELWRSADPRIAITPAMRDELRDLKARTATGSKALLSGRNDVPRRLNHNVIDRWLAGLTATARKGHFAYVRELWRARASAQTSRG